MRFFIVDGLRAGRAPASSVRAATPVTAGCRMIKSPAEIALMQRANDITIAAYKAAFATLREGMTQCELGRNMHAPPSTRSAASDPWALRQLRRSTPRFRTAASRRSG